MKTIYNRVHEKSKNGKLLSKNDWILVPYGHPSIVSEDVFIELKRSGKRQNT